MLQDQSIKRKRVLFLDIIRGLAVVNMVAYHLLYDLVYIFGVRVSWFSITQCFVWEQFICFTFILVAGVSFHLSRAPWKNGLRLLGCGALLTAVTLVVISEERIVFGILHFLGCAILLTWVCRKVLQKIPPAMGMGVSLVLFAMVRNIPSGRISFFSVWEVRLSADYYSSPLLFWAGFPNDQFFSADYFPVLPWIFLFLIGYFAGEWWIRGSEMIRKTIYLKEKSIKQLYEQDLVQEQSYRRISIFQSVYRIFDQSLGAVGRKSLWIYMLHQPLIYGILLGLHKLDWLS